MRTIIFLFAGFIRVVIERMSDPKVGPEISEGVSFPFVAPSGINATQAVLTPFQGVLKALGIESRIVEDSQEIQLLPRYDVSGSENLPLAALIIGQERPHFNSREASRRFEMMIYDGVDPNEIHPRRPRT